MVELLMLFFVPFISASSQWFGLDVLDDLYPAVRSPVENAVLETQKWENNVVPYNILGKKFNKAEIRDIKDMRLGSEKGTP